MYLYHFSVEPRDTTYQSDTSTRLRDDVRKTEYTRTKNEGNAHKRKKKERKNAHNVYKIEFHVKIYHEC